MGVNPDALAAILGLPKDAPERQWRLLAALGTFKPDADGWVRAGLDLVARTAGLHPDTVQKGRDELVGDARLKYEAGRGRGRYTRWLIVPPPRKHPVKGGTSLVEKGGSPPIKGGKPNALTSGNALMLIQTLLPLSPARRSSNSSSAPPTRRWRGRASKNSKKNFAARDGRSPTRRSATC